MMCCCCRCCVSGEDVHIKVEQIETKDIDVLLCFRGRPTHQAGADRDQAHLCVVVVVFQGKTYTSIWSG